ncbi:winged helix-turn-helix domain-containing protein [Actinocatenispora sera]|jgi:DNA-binding GntR family transcriptional regulator|uniref:HTH gntR-type domain-containing protein n=1 Tax=Actinocatenispora sera TaxID=390989 RepID=A0A810LA70_9ACTN|nr:winged helix-turn-helix domain-containing protein [Actinocatenispora sera]BCJ31492.1 hypothetical protein Asera_56000 [Actinocatenispora sera]
MEISGDVPRYKYEQAADVIEARIESGEWPVRLPGEIELSRDLGVGRNTLRHALRLLADRGVVKILPGVAVYVVKSADRDSDS